MEEAAQRGTASFEALQELRRCLQQQFEQRQCDVAAARAGEAPPFSWAGPVAAAAEAPRLAASMAEEPSVGARGNTILHRSSRYNSLI